VLEAARDAFVDGLQLAALTGAGLMAATAAVVALVLRPGAFSIVAAIVTGGRGGRRWPR